MTVVNLVENIPSKKLYDIGKYTYALFTRNHHVFKVIYAVNEGVSLIPMCD